MAELSFSKDVSPYILIDHTIQRPQQLLIEWEKCHKIIVY